MMNWWENDGRCRIDILKNAPDVIYQEYLEARKEPYIIHFAGYQKPWDVVDCDMAEYFWRYAKNTDWYLMLLQDIKRTLIHGYIPNRNEMETVCVPGYVHLLNKILPKGTPLRNGVRKIHHAINPKFES
jgi:lipopolysaccharide biosynthesis glycosyltransferase